MKRKGEGARGREREREREINTRSCQKNRVPSWEEGHLHIGEPSSRVLLKLSNDRIQNIPYTRVLNGVVRPVIILIHSLCVFIFRRGKKVVRWSDWDHGRGHGQHKSSRSTFNQPTSSCVWGTMWTFTAVSEKISGRAARVSYFCCCLTPPSVLGTRKSTDSAQQTMVVKARFCSILPLVPIRVLK